MNYTINQSHSMVGSDPTDTYTVTTSNNTSGAGLYWGMNGASGVPGQVLTTNGTSGSWITTDPSLKGASLQVKGDADFEGDVTIKGKNLTKLFENIEERLAILHPNEELETKWEKLRNLRKEYMELEAEIIEKEKVWKILKK